MSAVNVCSECERPGKLMLCFNCKLYFHALCGGYARHIEKGGYCMKPPCQKAKAHRYIKPKQLPNSEPQPTSQPIPVPTPAAPQPSIKLQTASTNFKSREFIDKNPPVKSDLPQKSKSVSQPQPKEAVSNSPSSNIFSSDSSSPQEIEDLKHFSARQAARPTTKEPEPVKKPKIANLTCHRCKDQFSSDQVVVCYNENCSENFCYNCLASRYGTIPKELPRDWECFVCCNTCRCHICRNSKTVKSRNLVPDFPVRQNKEAPRQIEKCHLCYRKSRTYKMARCKQCKRAYCVFCFGPNEAVCDACRGFCDCFDCQGAIYNDVRQVCASEELRIQYESRGDSLVNINGYWIRELK